MLELKITQIDYEELANKIDGYEHIRFHLDARGEIHYPLNIELSDELEMSIIRLCGEIGPDNYLGIYWWVDGKRLLAYVSDTKTQALKNHVDIQIIEDYQNE